MKIVIAPDSFKGSLSSLEIIKIIKKEIIKIFGDAIITEIPIADGGEGTIEALLYESDGKIINHIVTGPLGRETEAFYGVLGDAAIVEMAECSGLTLLTNSERNPLYTTSIGTGQMIKHVLDEGIRKIYIGIGGSATNDGGIGAMQALGVRFYDKYNNMIEQGSGEDLIKIDKIDIDMLDDRIKNCEISVMCDVINPLTGKSGATYVYGKQKGGDEKTLDALEKGMLGYEEKLNKIFDSEISRHPGAGAAGGMGAALLGFCGAKLISGIDAVLQLNNFSEKIKGADLIITGEGRVDEQSAYGKAIEGIAKYAEKEKTPVVVIAGGLGKGYEKIYEIGVSAIFAIQNRPMSLNESMMEAEKLIGSTVKNIFSFLKTMKLE